MVQSRNDAVEKAGVLKNLLAEYNSTGVTW